MDWELILKIASLLIGAIVSLYQLRNRQPRFVRRSQLKADLEILNMLNPSGPNDQNYQSVKKTVDVTIAKLYGGKSLQNSAEQTKKYDWNLLITGSIFLAGFSFWTWYLVRDGFSWWALFTGFFAFAGFGMLLGASGDRTRAVSVKDLYANQPGKQSLKTSDNSVKEN